MGKDSTIEWTDHTFNAWLGCTKVSPACDNCYAESWAKRTGNANLWTGDRRRTTRNNWRDPLKWNKNAGAVGARQKVFCSSLADVFDNQVPQEWRDDLFDLIDGTPMLDWLLLTKRPQNIAKLMPKRIRQIWDEDARTWVERDCMRHNVWLGTTAENQQEAERRIPHLLAVPAVGRFVSCEPLLDQIMLHNLAVGGEHCVLDALRGESWRWGAEGVRNDLRKGGARIHWVIAGGESGPSARPPMINWVRLLRNQCQSAGVAFHFKQWGEFTPDDPAGNVTSMRRIGKGKSGAMLDGREWREFPGGLIP